MTSKQFLKFSIIITTFIACLSAKVIFGQDTIKPKLVVKEKLPVPFGTLVKMSIEIVDGDELNDKGHQSSFLFIIKSVDSVILSKRVIIEFKDETGKFPGDEFELYKYLYGKKTGTISSKESEKMKKKYVGKEFNIVGYETGEFTGVPDGYFKYQPVRQDYGFHFKHYVIVVTGLTKRAE